MANLATLEAQLTALAAKLDAIAVLLEAVTGEAIPSDQDALQKRAISNRDNAAELYPNALTLKENPDGTGYWVTSDTDEAVLFTPYGWRVAADVEAESAAA